MNINLTLPEGYDFIALRSNVSAGWTLTIRMSAERLTSWGMPCSLIYGYATSQDNDLDELVRRAIERAEADLVALERERATRPEPPAPSISEELEDLAKLLGI